MIDPEAKETAMQRLQATLDEPLPARRNSAMGAASVAEAEMAAFMSAQQG